MQRRYVMTTAVGLASTSRSTSTAIITSPERTCALIFWRNHVLCSRLLTRETTTSFISYVRTQRNKGLRISDSVSWSLPRDVVGCACRVAVFSNRVEICTSFTQSSPLRLGLVFIVHNSFAREHRIFHYLKRYKGFEGLSSRSYY